MWAWGQAFHRRPTDRVPSWELSRPWAYRARQRGFVDRDLSDLMADPDEVEAPPLESGYFDFAPEDFDVVNDGDGDDGDDRPWPTEDQRRAIREYQASADRYPGPATVDFGAVRRHPNESYGEAYDDAFFRERHAQLFEMAAGWAERWFGAAACAQWPAGYHGSPWAEDLGAQFVEYARCVAHEDRLRAGWDAVLADAAERRWLVVAVLGQIVERKIWNELLFGADDDLAARLADHDLSTITMEGRPPFPCVFSLSYSHPNPPPPPLFSLLFPYSPELFPHGAPSPLRLTRIKPVSTSR